MKIREGYLNKFLTTWSTNVGRHETNGCKCKDFKPLHVIVSGVGGTGKSFVIETIRSLVKEMWKDDAGDDTTCAVAAPTGLAAHNVDGVTVH